MMHPPACQRGITDGGRNTDPTYHIFHRFPIPAATLLRPFHDNNSIHSPLADPSKTKRTRAQPSSQNSSASPGPQSQPRGRAPLESKRPTAKRRRRAPSPTRWIPFSLLAFDLTPAEYHKSTPVPLPPVKPSMNGQWIEERNSWDENVGIAPYHTDWTGKLPGPGFRIGHGFGLGGRDVANLGAGGYFMGRLSLV